MFRKTRIITVIIIILFTGVLSYLDAFGAIEGYYEDIMYQRGFPVPSDIKIIAIDDTALEKLGPYSNWNRSVFADLIDRLYSGDKHPRIVGLDVEFTGNADEESDESLVSAAAGRDIVLASKLNITVRSNLVSHTYEYFVSSEATSYEALSKVSQRGFTNAILDKDGYLRRVYTSVLSDGVRYDSFAISILNRLGEGSTDLPSVVEICYTGNPGDFEVVPLTDVLDGKVPAEHFADSIVLVGAYEDGMMDSYGVPVKHGNPMYGVEIQANAIDALRNGRLLTRLPVWADLLILVGLLGILAVLAYRRPIGRSCIWATAMAAGYVVLCFILYKVFLIKMQLLYIPLGMLMILLVSLVVRYVENQKRLASEMKQTLFSIADSMAEAIEGRTPYNANHTKNVAKRSVEMLHYINKLHREGKTELFFTPNDIDQMYLAAMLHDIGKMDVPLEVMDKSTKLGNKEMPLKDRLEIIKLHLQNDILSVKSPAAESEEQIRMIDHFLDNLDMYNCGKPLSDGERGEIEQLSKLTYITEEGKEIPYLTQEELEDLSIKAGTLSDKERKVMQSHVVYTNKILSHVRFGESFSKVSRIASDHHELLNGKGYPNGIGADELDVMTRILTIMDIYDSLTADDRPYKKPKSVKAAFDILDEEAEAGKVDKELLAIAKELYLTETGNT